jgi:hypothetical protein
MNFLKKNILKNNIINFKTQEEKDWSYIALREYNYKVRINAGIGAFTSGWLGCNVLTFL